MPGGVERVADVVAHVEGRVHHDAIERPQVLREEIPLRKFDVGELAKQFAGEVGVHFASVDSIRPGGDDRPEQSTETGGGFQDGVMRQDAGQFDQASGEGLGGLEQLVGGDRPGRGAVLVAGAQGFKARAHVIHGEAGGVVLHPQGVETVKS